MKGRDKTEGDAGTWGDTCEICNPKKQSVHSIAYLLKKMGRKGQYLPFLLSTYLKTGSNG
jgi:hypothetical protein